MKKQPFFSARKGGEAGCTIYQRGGMIAVEQTREYKEYDNHVRCGNVRSHMARADGGSELL